MEGYDLDTLAGSAWVNDKIMDYYLMKIRDLYRERKAAKRTDIKIHFFNGFFFTKLLEHATNVNLPSMKVRLLSRGCKAPIANGGRALHSVSPNRMQVNYALVQRWTKGVDVFAMDYIIVPIHRDAHWSVAVICQPGTYSPHVSREDMSFGCQYRWLRKSVKLYLIE